MPSSAELQAILDGLLARPPGSLDLDDLADALTPTTATYADVEEMISALESAGVLVDRVNPADLAAELAQALAAARALTTKLGRRPSVDEIAARAGLTAIVVRRALRFASVLAR
jgi:hypothetical protein